MRTPWRWARERWAQAGTLTRLIETWREDSELDLPEGGQLGLKAYRTLGIVYACVTHLATSAAEPDDEPPVV